MNIIDLFTLTYEREFQLKKDYEELIDTVEETVIKVDKYQTITFLSKTLFDHEPLSYIGRHVNDFEFLNKNTIQRAILFREKGKWDYHVRDKIYEFKVFPNLNSEKDDVIIVLFDITDVLHRKEEKQKISIEETSIKSKIEFMTSISHEIRNPLQAVNHSIDNLSDTNLDNTQHEYLSDIKASNKLLTTIIRDIIDSSKLESGKMVLENEKINLLEMCENCIEINHYEAKKKNLKLNFIFDLDLPKEITSDVHRISQVINNFLSNAIKFSKKGTISLILNHFIKGKYKFLKFIVKDEGVGISNEKLRAMFSQMENSDKLNHGWGLGLSISNKLAHLLNGEIGFESQLNNGSSFWLQIPVNGSSKEKIIPTIDSLYKNVAVLHPNQLYSDFLTSLFKSKLKCEKVMKELPKDINLENMMVVIHHSLINEEIKSLKNAKIVVLGTANDCNLPRVKDPIKIMNLLDKFSVFGY